MARHKVLNTPAIRRMPMYLNKLMLMFEAGDNIATTSKFAEYFNLDPIVIRKDFELTGVQGAPGVGYNTVELIRAIRHYLGWDHLLSACLVGAGTLGSALLGYHEFVEYGLRITDVFDSDPLKIGSSIRGYHIRDVKTIRERYAEDHPRIAIICVTSSEAQQVVDELISCGVTAFWNFANVSLRVPPDVIVQREVIAGGLALLSMKLQTHQSHISLGPENPAADL